MLVWRYDRVGVERTCIVFTAIPNTEVAAADFANALSQMLGVKQVLPVVNDLKTVDGVHLTASSAERWSKALLEQADPVILTCVTR